MVIEYIAFRVDASNQIGTGHFMRCLTLTNELRKQDVQIRFISRNLPTHLIDILITQRCGVFHIQGQWMRLTILRVGEAHLSGVKLLRRSC